MKFLLKDRERERKKEMDKGRMGRRKRIQMNLFFYLLPSPKMPVVPGLVQAEARSQKFHSGLLLPDCKGLKNLSHPISSHSCTNRNLYLKQIQNAVLSTVIWDMEMPSGSLTCYAIMRALHSSIFIECIYRSLHSSWS